MPVNNPSSVFGSLDWFNVQDYGAVGDGITDDTSAIQSTINACSSAGGGTVYFPAGIYIVGGALQNITGANAQLILPDIDADTDQQLSIKFLGAFPPYPIPSVTRTIQTPIYGSIIKSTVNSGTDGNLLGCFGSGNNSPFSNVMVWAENLVFRLPNNPVLTALDFENCVCVDIRNSVIDCGNYSVYSTSEPTTSTSYGIKLPAINNGVRNNVIGIAIINIYTGIKLSEHAIVDAVEIFACEYAVEVPATYHAISIERLGLFENKNGIRFTGGNSYIFSNQLDIEHYDVSVSGSMWFVPVYDIDDPNNYANGIVKWHSVLANSGPSSVFVKNGGSHLVTDRFSGNGIAVRTTNSSNQSIPTGTVTALLFNTEQYDVSDASVSMHDNSTNNSRLTCKVGGIYHITGNIRFAANTIGIRQLQILLNGTTVIAQKNQNANSSGATHMDISTDYALNYNDYVELTAFNGSSSAINSEVHSSGNSAPVFQMYLIKMS